MRHRLVSFRSKKGPYELRRLDAEQGICLEMEDCHPKQKFVVLEKNKIFSFEISGARYDWGEWNNMICCKIRSFYRCPKATNPKSIEVF